MENKETYTLQELANQSKTPARTIRYYISKELLAPPLRVGRGASYNNYHLHQLETIQQLKAQGYSLNEIRRNIITESPKETLPEPITWWSYTISNEIIVNIKADTSPWRVNKILKQMKKMIVELEIENEE